MKKDTRIAYNRLLDRIAELSGVPSAKEQFAIEPTVQQTLESKIQESSQFLSAINVVGVDELKGQKLGLGVTGPIASRTDVTQRDRTTTDVSALEAHDYECAPTEFDTHITWAKLDAWAKFPDFQTRVRNAIVRQQALDRIMIGFNGTSAAVETDRATNPLLQDVNIGWLQQYRDHAPARVLREGANVGEVRVGPGGDYENLDALVYDVVNEMLDPWFQESTDLRAICGRKILADKYFPLISEYQQPTEQRALDMIVSQKRMGGQQAARVPFMPDGTLLITPPENLSLYWQNGSRRRYLEENPKRNRVENYESSNDAYVVEDYGFGCLVENIVFGDWTTAA
ncbi:phage major capsid protein, P2 family [Modicisalibacter muralis]|uniref:Phage major capsid protein, P2 family n=1 Tax=Modicisalibacter muralis TaxID=119000 RepID=A0A1G9ERG5_9GAMM|nr:phage major capsid protein, P2 family [Halomonas muralis]SDK78720.1 phage major capsid protein, P2 family [Halomonas muralis]